MAQEIKLEQLALKLFHIDAVKFGKFITKSGMETPVYFDLRVIVSYPDVMELISALVNDIALKDRTFDNICGVPYTALPVATLVSILANTPMLMRRKEAKAYGTKKMIEGHYKAGQTCLVIEDVVTSGSSVLETVTDLRKEGLVTKEAIVILDREQGGNENLEKNGVKMTSLFTMTKLIEILVKNSKINLDMAEKVKNYLNETKAPPTENPVDRTLLTYERRAELASSKIAKQLFEIMASKQTNLCLSVDLTSSTRILDLIEKVGEHVCLVKTHIDIIEDFTPDFITRLKQLADRFNFMILEDRKFADIGNTVSLQYMKGLYRIGGWADCVTCHSLPGEGILKALNGSINGGSRGVFLLAEMSSESNLITPDYTAETVKMAANYPGLITGFVCQKKDTFQDPGLIQLTPGVQLQSCYDGLGQVYNTPEKVVLDIALKDRTFDNICGVPYTALPVATLVSILAITPMLMRRNEAQAYGTKKMIEGHYKAGQTCLVIEDVVTSGSSVLETVTDLRKEGLVTKEAIVILDREQGGNENLEKNGVKMTSLFTMTKLIKILVKNSKINLDMAEKVKKYLNETKAPPSENPVDRTLLPYEKRAELATRKIAKQLFEIMASK